MAYSCICSFVALAEVLDCFAGTAVLLHLQKFWIASAESNILTALEWCFEWPDGVKVPPEWHLGRPDGVRLTLECRFGLPHGGKLALERHFGLPDGT